MDADTFLKQPGSGKPIQDIDSVIRQWEAEGKSVPTDDLAGMTSMLAVLGVDAAVGDGLLNEVSSELMAAFEHLEGVKADTYDEVRQIIADRIARGDASVLGLINKIKGQIGEDRFVEAYADSALVESRNQEAVDAFIASADGSIRYIQVKMYADPEKVVKHMLDVHRKTEAQRISVDGELVDKVDFAVPADIADKVSTLASKHDELRHMNVLPIPATAQEVANVVQDSVSNIGHPLVHLGHEVIDGILSVAAIDALTSMYLVHTGKLSPEKAGQHAALTTTFSTVGITTSKGLALLLSKTAAVSNPIALPILVAVAARMLTRSWYERRVDLANRLQDHAKWLSILSEAFLKQPKSINSRM